MKEKKTVITRLRILFIVFVTLLGPAGPFYLHKQVGAPNVSSLQTYLAPKTGVQPRWEDLSPQQRAMIPSLVLALFRKDKEASPNSSITTENFFNVVSTPENDRFLSEGLKIPNLTVRDFERIIIDGFGYTWVAFRAAGLSDESRYYIPGTGRMVVVLREHEPPRDSPWTSDTTTRILEVLLKVSQSHPELLSEPWLKDLKSEELKRKWEETLRELGFGHTISFTRFTSKALNIFGNRKELLEIVAPGSVRFKRRRKEISVGDELGKVARHIEGIQDEFGLSQAEILDGLKAILELGSSI